MYITANDHPVTNATITIATNPVNIPETVTEAAILVISIPSVTPGDINGDTTVNILDVVLIANYSGKTIFDSRADVTPPLGVIDIFDVMVVVINWGKQY